jgi:hypothetical protein
LNPSLTAIPRPLPPPERVVIIPIFTVPAKAADVVRKTVTIENSNNLFIIFPLLYKINVSYHTVQAAMSRVLSWTRGDIVSNSVSILFLEGF